MAEFLKGKKNIEDIVQYRIFPPIPPHLEDEAITKYLEEQTEYYLITLRDVLVDYIWQHESFSLGVIPGSGSSPAHLFGSTNFGDNIEDEWFIVYILKRLTSVIKELVVQITDGDGEFLLIEAADDLPDWLEPETADNRVFLFDGKLHIIPEKENISNVWEAVDYIRGKSSSSQASNKVQKDIDKRLKGFPEKVQTSIHHANCYIPASLAAVLSQQPALVAPIVRAFYYRDPVDLKACVTFRHFRPGTRVMRRVRMTRCLYAQLQQQQFEADKRSGYILPPPSNPQYKAQQLGMKLAHGAEMLCSKCDGHKGPVLSQHPRWKKFLHALSQSGYFQGELEGSRLYCKLLENAENFYKASVTTNQSEKCGAGETTLHLLKTLSFNMEEMRKEEMNLPPEDDDSWMELTPEQLDKMMKEKFGDAFTNTQGNLEEMVGSMKSFINKESSHEGAEFPNHDEEDVEFDSNSFVHTMQKMFEFQDEASSSSDDMSEYASDNEASDVLSPSSTSQTSFSSHSNGSTTSHPQKTPSSAENTGDRVKQEPSVKDYMELMDRELGKTTLAESFVTEADAQERPIPPPRRKKKNVSAAGNTKTAPGRPAPKAAADDIDDLDEDFQPVNVNLNLVSNLLESYSSQDGMAGPTSNILGSMGMHLPPPDTSDEHLD